MNKKQSRAFEEEIELLNKKIEKLNKSIRKAKRISAASAVMGAIITTIFSIFNVLYAAIISFAATLIIAFFIDFAKKVLVILRWKSNNLRNEFMVSDGK